MKKVLNITFRTILYLITGLIGLFLLLLVLLQVPSVQNYLGKKTADLLSSKLETTVTVNEVNWKFFDHVALKKIYIEDRANDTLIYAKELNVDIDMFQLFNKKVNIDRIKLENALVNISREQGEKDFNYSFILKAFQPEGPADTTWQFGIKDIHLKSTSLNYIDAPQAMEVFADLESSTIAIEKLGMDSQHLVIDKTILEGLNLIVNQTDNPVDTAITKPSITGPLWTFSIRDLAIKESHFAYNDANAPPAPKGIDYSHLSFSNINGTAADLQLKGENFKAEIQRLALNEKAGLNLQDLKGNIRIQENSLNVLVDKILTVNTNIHNRVEVTIPSLDNIENTIGIISAKGNFNKDTIAVNEVYYFIPNEESPQQLTGKRIALSGNLEGKLNDFSFENLSLQVDKNNSIKGDIAARGLPTLNKTYIHLDLEALNTRSSFIKSFIPDSKELPVNLTTLGNIRAKGTVKGYTTNFSADLQASTSIGSVGADMKIKLDTSWLVKDYSGNIAATHFNLGKLLTENTGLGSVTVNSSIKGDGKDIRSFETTIHSAEYNHYTYQDILASGSFINKVFKARVQAEDPNLQADLLAEINMRNKKYSYQAEGTIEKINLHSLNFTQDSLTLGAKINAGFRGNNIDNMAGSIEMDSLMISNPSQTYIVDSAFITAELNNGIREIIIRSPIAEANVSGQFTFSELPAAANHLLSHYYSAFKTKGTPVHLQSLDFNIKTGDISPILKIFAPEVRKLDSLKITGSFRQESHELTMNASVNHFTYQDKDIKNIYLTANADKKELAFHSGASEVVINEKISLQAPEATGSFVNNKLVFNAKIHEQTASTRVNMNGILTYSNELFNLTFPEAELVIDGKEWNLSEGNRIRFGEDYLTIQDLELSEGEQRITINSNHLSGENTRLNAQLSQVKVGDLSKLAGITEYELNGKINGQVQINDLFHNYGLKAEATINELSVNKHFAGNLELTADKNSGSELISLNATIKNKQNNASAIGTYRVDNQAIDLAIDIENLNLQLVQPFVKQYAYKLQGNVEADIKATGTIQSPSIIGSLTFKHENVAGLVATQTEYSFYNQKIIFDESAIQIKDFVLYDPSKDKAIADGAIYHQRFNDLRFDLKLHSDNFQLLNTTAESGAVLYGEVYAMVDASLSGPVKDLDIDLTITTKENTELFIPLLTAQAVGVTPDYINYTSIEKAEKPDSVSLTAKEDSIVKDTLKNIQPKIDLSKFNVNGRLNVTQDAEINVVVDPVNGDKIVARGEGNFRLDFSSDNEVNLFGTYIIDEGSYTFTFANLLKRNFNINEGSTISWAGDPEEATLNISGIYKTKASRYELVADQADFMTKEEINAAKRPLPVYVHLEVTGELLHPEISFDIEVPEGSDALSGGLVTQRINEIKNDPTQLNTQVFGLIVLNKFIAPEAISGTGPGSIAYRQAQQSVTGIINSQLSNLTDDYLSGINLNVNLEALDPTYGAFAQTAQISASKEISDRITVTVGGTTTIGSSHSSGQFAGDYNVLYQLNKSGSVNVKFFRTSTQNIYTSNLNTITGSSVSYRKRFNSWKSIFGRDKPKTDNQSQN